MRILSAIVQPVPQYVKEESEERSVVIAFREDIPDMPVIEAILIEANRLKDVKRCGAGGYEFHASGEFTEARAVAIYQCIVDLFRQKGLLEGRVPPLVLSS